ncbi:MAG: ParB/RepB/Spo0J family partition protein [Saprospiraceae bacterium]|nr:ParB/RepB/Spo0J family partition protein [Saprospiraceae bacterium]
MAKLKKLEEQSRGLDELLGSSEPVIEIVRELTHTVIEIPLEQIEVNPWQPRKDFDEAALQELSDSIKLYGLIQPITLRRMAVDQYQLISGERRFQASKLAGLKALPAYIRLADDQAMAEMALVENLLREDLNAIEVANTYQRLKDEFGLTDEQLSKRVDKNRSTVTNMLRLLKLPPNVQESIKEKRISTGHAKVLAGIKDIALQLALHEQIVKDRLSVRELEDIVTNYSTASKPKPKKTTPSVPDAYKLVVDNLSGFFGSKIQFKRKPTGAGQIVVNFKNDTDLNRILDLIEEKG